MRRCPSCRGARQGRPATHVCPLHAVTPARTRGSYAQAKLLSCRPAQCPHTEMPLSGQVIAAMPRGGSEEQKPSERKESIMASSTTRPANSETAGSSPCTSEAHPRAVVEDMTREQWQKLHRDFKACIDGKYYVLRFIPGQGTCLCPVLIIGE